MSTAFGVRWLSGDGDGLSLALHAAFFSADIDPIGDVRGDFEDRNRIAVGLTVGWRFQLSRWIFLDLGIGPAVQFLHDRGQFENRVGPGLRVLDDHYVRAGFIWGAPTPDFDLAVGFQF